MAPEQKDKLYAGPEVTFLMGDREEAMVEAEVIKFVERN